MKLQASKYYLLGVGSDPKTSVDIKRGYMVGILYLAPARLSGREVCFGRSEGCTAACYNSAGRGAMKAVQEARIRKTQMYFEARPEFFEQLTHDIELLSKKAAAAGLKPAVRLNGTSDIPWEIHAKDLMLRFPEIDFYDYTKLAIRAGRWIEGTLPPNYHLTYSKSENNWVQCLELLNAGGNVAIAFGGNELPTKYFGYEVVDGDASDLRFLDLPSENGLGKIIGLRARGRGKKDTSGFIVYLPPPLKTK